MYRDDRENLDKGIRIYKNNVEGIYQKLPEGINESQGLIDKQDDNSKQTKIFDSIKSIFLNNIAQL